MNTRSFPALGREVSEIGLGCWQIGAEWGAIDDATARRVLAAARDAGVTFLDTADVYGQGRSEERIGAYLRESGWRPTIASKLGRFPEPGWPENFAPAVMRQHVEASLRRLGVDCLDLLQLHCAPPEQLERGDVFETMRALRAAGLIRAFGASVESTREAALCLAQDGLASLQVIFNVFRQTARDEVFDDAQSRGVAIIVRLPLASGLLTGKYDSQTTFGEDDHRNFNRDGTAFHVGETFAGLQFSTGLELVDRLRRLAPRNWPLVQLAHRWILDHDAVTTVITGASRPDHVTDNAATSRLRHLPDEVHAELHAFWDDHVQPHVRGHD